MNKDQNLQTTSPWNPVRLNTRRRRNHASSRNLAIVIRETPNTAPTSTNDLPSPNNTNARRCSPGLKNR